MGLTVLATLLKQPEMTVTAPQSFKSRYTSRITEREEK